MASPVRVVQFGIGPIGLECLRTILSKQSTGVVELVGAIDIDPRKAGRDIADVLGGDTPLGITVGDDARAVLEASLPDVVIHTTGSFLEAVSGQIEMCVRAGAHVISSTEELSFPYDRHPALSDRLDRLAREHGVVVVGTGVNPGFAMDTLALMATGVCVDVTRVDVTRIVDAGKRRLPLQKKVGAGLTEEQFEERRATGTFGHIGLMESLRFLAAGLGWELDKIDERLRPLVADRDIRTPHVHVEKGRVAGIHHDIVGRIGSEIVLTLDLRMYVGAEDPHDGIRVTGTPPVDLVIRDGIFGDTATVATLVNAIPLVGGAPAGLKTMMDLPVPRAFGADSAVDKKVQAA